MGQRDRIVETCYDAADGDYLLALDYACDVLLARDPDKVERMRNILRRGDPNAPFTFKSPTREKRKSKEPILSEISDDAHSLLTGIAAGLSTIAAAHALSINYERAKEHLAAARRTLGADNNTQAVAIAIRTGVL